MAFVFGVATLAVFQFSFEWPFKALMIILLLTLWWGSYQTYGLLKSRRFWGEAVTCLWLRENQWLLTLASGKTVEAVLKSGSYFSYRLSVLNFTILDSSELSCSESGGANWSFLGVNCNRRLKVVLFPDSADPEMLRRLRVRLNLGGQNLLG